MPQNSPLILLRGGGDLASGVALRLHRAGFKLVIAELPQPLAVRRTVSFAEAVYEKEHTVEGIKARLVKPHQIQALLDLNEVPVIIDPYAEILLSTFHFLIAVDARLIKQPPSSLPNPVPLHIGLGPGFHAGRDCHAVVETRRSHTLGRVYWEGVTQPDSGQPEGDTRRVLRAPSDGIFTAYKKIGDSCDANEAIGKIEIGNQKLEIANPIAGVLRGVLRDGLQVSKGLKIGDVDPRGDVSACFLVSDKALAIGGGVLEAMLSREEIRNQLWDIGKV